MKRYVNFRPIAAVALSFLLGIILCYFRPAVGAWAIAIAAAVILIGFLIAVFLFRNVSLSGGAILAVLCFAFALSGYGRFYISALTVENGKLPSGSYTVTGKVVSISVGADKKSVGLSACVYDGKRGGNLFIYDFDGDVQLYDEVQITCNAYPAVTQGVKSYNYYLVSKTSMIAQTNGYFERTGRAGGFLVCFKAKADDIFGSVAAKDEAAIAIALFTGDTSRLDIQTLTGFRLSGIAHIFAVSGMHIGLLYSAFTFLTARILKNKRILKAVTISAILFIYAGVCGFSASSLRAAIMCTVVSLASAFGTKNDRLNGLAISLFIVSAINPTDVFTIGFQLSFIVCLSIITIAPPIKRKLAFLPENIALPLSVVFAAELASLPLSIKFFGYFPVAAILLNVILLPVITIAYYLLWIGFVFCLLIPVNRLIGLYIPYLLLRGTRLVADFTSAFGLFLTYFPTGFYLIYYPALSGASDAVNLGKYAKRLCAIAVFAVIIAVVVVSVVAN